MNLSTIARQVRTLKVKSAVEGLENVNERTVFGLGVLSGKVQAYEEVAQLLEQLDKDDKYGDPLG